MNANYNLENQGASRREAEKLAKQLKEYLKELDKNRNFICLNAKTVFKKIKYEDLDSLAWGHMFYGRYLEPNIRLKIEDKTALTILVSKQLLLLYYRFLNQGLPSIRLLFSC